MCFLFPNMFNACLEMLFLSTYLFIFYTIIKIDCSHCLSLFTVLFIGLLSGQKKMSVSPQQFFLGYIKKDNCVTPIIFFFFKEKQQLGAATFSAYGWWHNLLITSLLSLDGWDTIFPIKVVGQYMSTGRYPLQI